MTNGRISSIQTLYRGITYRSRTEARWAVYLDELRVAYAYEPEGIDLNGEWYLPDFWLPSPGVWLEVKGIEPTPREQRLAMMLSKASRCAVLIAVGAPSISGEFNLRVYENGQSRGDAAFTGSSDDLLISSACQGIMLTVRGSVGNLPGIPEPITSAARVAGAERFGVY